jgi:hypothetical protein
VKRNRDAELAAAGESSVALREKWTDIRRRADEVLEGLPRETLDRTIEHNNLGRMTGLELLLHVGRHTAEHLGEAQLTRGLLGVTGPLASSG